MTEIAELRRRLDEEDEALRRRWGWSQEPAPAPSERPLIEDEPTDLESGELVPEIEP